MSDPFIVFIVLFFCFLDFFIVRWLVDHMF